MAASKLHAWPAVNDNGVIAMVSLGQLQKALNGGRDSEFYERIFKAGEFSHVIPDHSLNMALDPWG